MLPLLLFLLQTTLTLPSPTEGVIDGKEALMIWPADESGMLLDRAGCNVHLSPLGDPETHLTYPCGRWIVPPAQRRYDYWLEQGNRISDGKLVLYYSGLPAERGFLIVSGMGPAGYVNVAARPGEGETVRIVSFRESDRVFDLRLRPEEMQPQIRVPAGMTIGGVFDEHGDATALSKPTEVIAGKTVSLAPAKPPAGKSDLQVILQKRGSARPKEMRVALIDGGRIREPDFVRENESRLFAFWYGLSPGNARVTITATGLETASHPVGLSAGRVSTLRLTYPLD